MLKRKKLMFFLKVKLFRHHQIGFFMKQKELFKFKVFDTLNHYLLNAKLEVYGLSAKSYSYIHSHLNKRLQRQILVLILVCGKKFNRSSSRIYSCSTFIQYMNINDIFFFVEETFLRKTIDSRLTFYSHLKQLCNKVANKLNTLTNITPYLSHNQRRLICSSFLLEN